MKLENSFREHLKYCPLVSLFAQGTSGYVQVADMDKRELREGAHRCSENGYEKQYLFFLYLC